MPLVIVYVLLGVGAGLSGGLFGIGGGIVIVPALVYFAGFSQHRATGTSLAILLPPIGIGAVMEYYGKGNVDVTAAVIMMPTMLLGMWLGAAYANQISGPQLRMFFGVFLCFVGVYLAYGAWAQMRAG